MMRRRNIRRHSLSSPDNLAAMLGLASAYLNNNDLEKAMETARLALEHSPDDPELNLVWRRRWWPRTSSLKLSRLS